MPADITKCISGNNYKEGSAVSVQGAIVNPFTTISSARGTTKDWSLYITTLSKKWKYPLYYTEGYPLIGTTADYATATNASAVVTYAADAYAYHSIEGVAWSYSGTPGAGALLKIEDGSGTVIFSEDITASGPGFFQFEEALRGSVNADMIITLTAGGSGVVGKINVIGHKVQ
jgi:hypothetical protein